MLYIYIKVWLNCPPTRFHLIRAALLLYAIPEWDIYSTCFYLAHGLAIWPILLA